MDKSGRAGYEVFMGNYATHDQAQIKAKELKSRRFLRVDIQRRLFAVEVMECVSYVTAEETREILKSLGYMPYSIRCRERGSGKTRVLVGAYETEEKATLAALTLMNRDQFSRVTLTLR